MLAKRTLVMTTSRRIGSRGFDQHRRPGGRR